MSGKGEKSKKTNDQIWAEIKQLEDRVVELKKTLAPAELPKQADLNHCNKIARKAKTKQVQVNPKRLSDEKGIVAKARV